MLDEITPALIKIGLSIEDHNTQEEVFPVWANLCVVGKQVTNVLQYTRSIVSFLKAGSIINPLKCNTVTFRTDYGDFGGGYNYIQSEDGNNHAELYNDCEYYLALDYDGLIIAFVGFNISDDGEILVEQIQGAKLFGSNHSEKTDHNGYLKNFKWKEYLVTELIGFLKKNNIGNQVKIQSAKNNSWLEVSSYVNRQPGQRGYKTYDQVAIGQGFTGTPEDGYILKFGK